MSMFSRRDKAQLPTPDEALPGRLDAPVHRSRAPLRAGHAARAAVSRRHAARAVRHGLLLGRERMFWQAPGVYTTAVGYAGGSRRTRPTRRCAPA